ncbi:MAG: SAM-dependent methyltransferase [Oscillospiraceae bacterium]|nr:SAM-dependent methyltransferase [Oscillospiraceae bacterium]
MSRLYIDLKENMGQLSKLVLSQPISKEIDSKVSVRPLLLKDKLCFQIERFRDNKAFHQNVSDEELLKIFENELDGRYRQALLVSDAESAQYSLKVNGSYKKSSQAALPKPGGVQSHNREKEYILKEGENIPAMVDLGVFTQEMKIVRSKYDKYKQINRFIELIDQQFNKSKMQEICILDFGCGKSYLTFILYYYFTVKKGMKATIIGYDLKADVVERCNKIAQRYGYDGLEFVKADVSKDVLYDRRVDMLVTLHACDTATDYALHYAVTKNVEYIFSVPCCQHEINSSIKKGGDYDIMLRYGIIKERVSALLTDSIRAAVLEDMGYSVDMIEFVDFEHSPKNIMIRAKRNNKKSDIGRKESAALCEKYGFTQKLLNLCSGGEN